MLSLKDENRTNLFKFLCMKKIAVLTLMAVQLMVTAFAQSQKAGLPQVSTVNGIVEGIDDSGIRTFKGIPFAAPPVGDLRWKEPQAVTKGRTQSR